MSKKNLSYEDFLEEKGRLWAERLRVFPPVWDELTLAYQPPDKMGTDLGHCFWQIEYKQAWINILDPDYPALYQSLGDDIYDTIERTIVHELLHLRLEGHQKVKGGHESYEYALNVVADALVDLERENAKKSANKRRNTQAKKTTVGSSNKPRVPRKRNTRV